MYDREIELLEEKLSALTNKSLRALADGDTARHLTLATQIGLLQGKIKRRQEDVQKAFDLKKENDIKTLQQITSSRLRTSQEELRNLDCDKMKVEVLKGKSWKSKNFSLDELLLKVNNILKKEKRFIIGDKDYKGLTVNALGKKVVFDYHHDDRTKYKFRMEVSDMTNMKTFINSSQLISCSTTPEIEHGVCSPHLTDVEKFYIYRGEHIIQHLFETFAENLYGK
jgi:hypothetical protein